MSGNLHAPPAPAAQDVVEIVDSLSGARVSAIVESANGDQYVLTFERANRVAQEAPVRWYDGDTAWQAVSRIQTIDETSVNCQLAPPPDWEPAPVRTSLRAAVDNAPMLVRIVESSVLAKARRVHAVCLDISDSGCRASWPGTPPVVGDSVGVAWDVGDWHSEVEPSWISARVARVIPLPFGARQVGFKFEIANAAQAACVRAWHQTWLQRHRERLRDQIAAD